MPFLDEMDIGNLALQLCGAPQILDPTEDSKSNVEVSFAYDKARRTELSRNNWRFATRNVVLRPLDAYTRLLVPTAYSATTTYLAGAIVKDTNGLLWLSMQQNNLNNSPGGNNEVWEPYFGSLTIEPWDTTGETAYSTGELVYMAGTLNGSYVIYQSRSMNNEDTPNVATAWDATVEYNGNSVVSYSGVQWSSLIELNLSITPAVGPLAWSASTAYTIGQTVTGTDNFIYSAVGSTTGSNPVGDAGVHWTNTGVANAWQHSPAIAASSTNWRVIDATMKTLAVSYPVGAGPSSQTETKNVYRLPAGYLKLAPQDPKAGSNSPLGGPSGRPYDDWNFEGQFLVSDDTGPILFRFVADYTKVSGMQDLFCKGLACSIATTVCQPLTQSEAKLGSIASQYAKFMSEARTANFIEIGAIEPPEDDWISCRV